MDQDNQQSSQISPDQVRRLITAVRTEQVANDFVDEQVNAFMGINRTDGRCLDIVDQHKRITAGRLAAESGLTTGAVTALVDRLEAAGYLRRVRDLEDRRRIFIETTERAHAFTRRLFSSIGPMLQGMMEQLTPAGVEAIIYFLEAGAYMNQQRARLLQDHLPPHTATIEERLAIAEEYDRAAHELAPSVTAQLRDGSFPRDFCDPDD
jgi:DNA-binding MarR family transcriptional regulator